MGTPASHHASKPLTVAVTGATGFVGRRTVRELLSRGHAVRALARDRVKARRVFAGIEERLTIVGGDVTDAKALGDLVRGADAAIHLVGILREAPGGQSFQKCHVNATEATLEACAAAGVKRYLHMSALGVCSEGVSKYQKTKWEAERLVHASNLDWTIFRPGLIHGEGGEFIQMAAQWCRGKGPMGVLPYFTRWEEDLSVPLGPSKEVAPVVAPVSVDDVAAAFAGALVEPKSIGETYNLVGSEKLSWPEMLVFMRDRVPHADSRVQPWGLPGFAAAGMAIAAKQIGLGSALPFDAGMALMGARDSVAEGEKVRTHLGLSPRPFRAAFAAYAERL
jgi:uncharacterized protein YbjT (DUF2867 family)